MTFGGRLERTQVLVETLDALLWGVDQIRSRLVHVVYGSEHYVPREVHQLIRYVRTVTVRHIRFAPDAFVVDKHCPERTYLLEYKCTQTPLYSQARIGVIRSAAADSTIDWPDIGQWEAEAFDNYQALAKMGIRLAVANYCAYHGRPLLCEFVDKLQPLHRDSVQLATNTGSRTPFVNFDLRLMRTMAQFLVDEHSLPKDSVESLCAAATSRLISKLPVQHHVNSPYR